MSFGAAAAELGRWLDRRTNEVSSGGVNQEPDTTGGGVDAEQSMTAAQADASRGGRCSRRFGRLRLAVRRDAPTLCAR